MLRLSETYLNAAEAAVKLGDNETAIKYLEPIVKRANPNNTVEGSYVDYFVTNNIAVSRSHADIITRSGKYYVIDLNSKNHTYINDKEIPVQVEIEILNGDKLTLGNEEFIFKN